MKNKPLNKKIAVLTIAILLIVASVFSVLTLRHNKVYGETDLVSVVGDNGHKGYVRYSEMENMTGGNVNSLDEAKEWIKQQDNPVMINVYKKDGKTVIDTFTLDGHSSISATTNNDLATSTAYKYRSNSSSYKSNSGYKYSYKYNSSCLFYTSGDLKHYGHAGTCIKQNGSKNVPVGYMGAQARLFKSNGQLIKSSSWQYNSSKANEFNVYTSSYYSKSGYFYSQGKVKIYNGNGYNTYTATKTPNVQAGSNICSIEELITTNNCEYSLNVDNEYKTNSEGETYGCGLDEAIVGEEPDYIAASGTKGESGYIKSDDLDSYYSSPKKAANDSLDDNESEKEFIPLYDKEGNVIGKFLLTTEVEVKTDKEVKQEVLNSTQYSEA